MNNFDTEKIFAQKAYEKLEMAKRNPEMLSVMVASDDIGLPHLVLTLHGRPIAELMSQDHIDSLEPNFSRSERLQGVFKEMSNIDSRKHPKDFDVADVGFAQKFEQAMKKAGL